MTEDFRGVINNLGEKLTPNEIREIMKEADLDGDGFIDYAEFVKLLMSKWINEFILSFKILQKFNINITQLFSHLKIRVLHFLSHHLFSLYCNWSRLEGCSCW